MPRALPLAATLFTTCNSVILTVSRHLVESVTYLPFELHTYASLWVLQPGPDHCLSHLLYVSVGVLAL